MSKLDKEYFEAAKLIGYDKDTGRLYWIDDNSNATHRHPDGYEYVYWKRGRIIAHRLAWVIHYGNLPAECLDHVNMDRADNRLSNLREASVSENNRNRTKQSNNTSGYKGVSLNKASGKYQARVTFNKVTFYLGYFDDPVEASNAYIKACGELHGQFARQ